MEKTMKALVLVAMLGTMGCAVGDTTPLPGQDRAVAIIWNQIYGQTNTAPPIYWRRDRCNEPNGIYAPVPTCSFDDLSGEAVSGLERDTPWHVEVGAPWGNGKISDTSLAHELLHAVIGDQGHHSEKWLGCAGHGEYPPSLLCMAHESLIAAGL
jgi:hypothetical protein